MSKAHPIISYQFQWRVKENFPPKFEASCILGFHCRKPANAESFAIFGANFLPFSPEKGNPEGLCLQDKKLAPFELFTFVPCFCPSNLRKKAAFEIPMARPSGKRRRQKEEDQAEQKIAAGDANRTHLPEENGGNLAENGESLEMKSEAEVEGTAGSNKEVAMGSGDPSGDASRNAIKGRLRRAPKKVSYDEEVVYEEEEEEEDGLRKRKRGRKPKVKPKVEEDGAAAEDQADGGKKRKTRGRPGKKGKGKTDTKSENGEGGDMDEEGCGNGGKSLKGAKYERWDPKVKQFPHGSKKFPCGL